MVLADFANRYAWKKIIAEKLSNKFGLMLLFASILIRILTISSCPGSFYVASNYFNLFLPNFGQNSDISIIEQFRTLATQYILKDVVLEIFNKDILMLDRFFQVLTPVLTFLAYYLFFGLVKEFKDYRILISGFLSLIVGWPSIALMLGMVTLFLAINKKPYFSLLLLISFTTLSLLWHTGHMLFLINCIALLGGVFFFRKRTYQFVEKIIVIMSVSVLTWLYVRNLPVFSNLFDISTYLDPVVIYKAIFSKGSFVLSDYSYQPSFSEFDPIFSYSRYILYFVVIFSVALISFRSIFSRNRREPEILGLSLLVGTLFFTALYFIGAGIIAPVSIIVFLIPLFIAFMVRKIKYTNRKAPFILLLLIVASTITVTTLYTTYTNTKMYPEYSESFELYHAPAVWLASHVDGVGVLSDCNTLAYVSIWYGKDALYQKSELYFSSIDDNSYGQLVNGGYASQDIIIYNYHLYRENLVFESLQNWNKYQPLSPDILNINNLNLAYNSGDTWFLLSSKSS